MESIKPGCRFSKKKLGLSFTEQYEFCAHGQDDACEKAELRLLFFNICCDDWLFK